MKTSFPKEIIGLQTEVIDSSNSQIIGIKGTIVNETKSMFTINTPRGLKQIPKNFTTWRFYSNTNSITLAGNRLEKRPQDREAIN